MTTLHRFFQFSILLSAIFLVVIPGSVSAHARWVIDSITPPRTNDTGLKANPCGNAARVNSPVIFSGGQTIEVSFEETINHPGHYRIAFSPANDLNFDSYVLVDNIPDTTSTGVYKQEITLPTQICSECTLQLIQVMTTNPNPQPGDFYYSCTDIQITNPGDVTAPMSISNLQSLEEDGQATMTWDNPSSDFYRVVVLKNNVSVSTMPSLSTMPVDGVDYSVGDMINGSEVIYVGNASSITATSLLNDNNYIFKVFSQNPRKNFSGGNETSVTPRAVVDTGATGPNVSNTTGGGGSIHLFGLFVLMLWMMMGKTEESVVTK